MNKVLLTVSGEIKPDIEQDIADGKRPKADYIHMAEAFGADLIDYKQAYAQASWLGRILHKIGGNNFLLAYICFTLRHKYETIFTDGEQVGIPLAILLKLFGFTKPRPKHLMIVHILSVGKKMFFFDWLSIHSHVDIFFVYSTWQKQFIQNRWDVPSHRVVWTPFMVDANFFSPKEVTKGIVHTLDLKYPDRPLICGVGLEFRDYPTLMKAVEDLPVQVVIAAGSPWSKREDSTEWYTPPDNVLVHRFSQHELRALYHESTVLTMSLYHVNFQAGVTALLEAMAMEKPIICTSTPGQTDVVIHDKTGYYVPPEDPTTLKLAIQEILAQPEKAREMGKRGRQRIEEEMSLEQYVHHLIKFVHPLGKDGSGSDNGLEEIVLEQEQLWTKTYSNGSDKTPAVRE